MVTAMNDDPVTSEIRGFARLYWAMGKKKTQINYSHYNCEDMLFF